MPAISLAFQQSTGHSCFPPTTAVTGFASTFFVNGLPIQLAQQTLYSSHACGSEVHTEAERFVTTGAPTFFVEGKPVARIGDDIACGDTVAEGSSNFFVGG